MALIDVVDLTFAYEGSYDNIFESVSFQIDTSWKLGFVGRNGRGKTTFLRLLQGCYEYSGHISVPVALSYFPYQVADSSAPVQAVMEQICPEAQPWQLLRELSLLEVEEEALYRPFATLSQGEQTKTLLAALFLNSNNFLLIDEPTNHLDIEARRVLGRYLRRQRGGFILVSHDRALLDDCVDHVLSINKANIEIQQGNFSSWWRNKELRDSFELAENAKLRQEIKRLENTAREKAAWSERAEGRKIGFDPLKTQKDIRRRPAEAAKAKKQMSRVKAIETRQQAALRETQGLLHNIENADNLKLKPLSYHQGAMVELEHVSLYYGETRVCHDVSFTVRQGDRLALAGKNGSGKTSLLKLICGEDITYSGQFRCGGGLIVSYVAQSAGDLRGDLRDYAARSGVEESVFKAMLRKLDFSRVQFDKDMAEFSAGQKKKVLLARSMCQQAHLYIWDEPLNYIDVLSRMQIEDLLLQYCPTLLFVEHDRDFCAHIATDTVQL